MRCTFFFLLLSSVLLSQTDLAVGTVIPKVGLETQTDKTFSVYLPRSYEPSKVYPAVFLFGKGEGTAQVVQQFTIAAELTESIIIGANYKMSDTLNTGLKQSEVLINSVLNRFAIDPAKIVLAGLDNGALIASTSAHLSKNVYGVIAVGNVFLDKKVLSNNSNAKFAILASKSSGYYYKLSAYKSRSGFKNIIKGYYEYDGEGWPSSGYLTSALTAIMLTDDTDPASVESYYESDINFARRLFKQNQELEAAQFTGVIQNKYRKLIDINEQKALLKEIRANRAYKIKKVRRSKIREEESLLLLDLQFYLKEDTDNAFFDNLGWWSYQMDALDLKIDSTASNKQERLAALRLKRYITESVEEKYEMMKLMEVTPEKLLFVNILRTLVNPQNAEAHIEVISLSAREGDENAALFYLEELMKTGYDDYERLYTIDNTIVLRTGYEFNEIIKAYLGKSKYYEK